MENVYVIVYSNYTANIIYIPEVEEISLKSAVSLHLQKMEDDSKCNTHEKYNSSSEDQETSSGFQDSTNSTKTNMTKQNATNFHPLMNPSVSQDFPDLIPENQRSKIFRSDSQSSAAELDSLEVKLNEALSNYTFDGKIQGRQDVIL